MLTEPTFLVVLWFILIAVLWIGFFFLEGFDFGVSMLYPILGKDPKERRVMINSIGPHWDGNEVWLITAGGAMFAAFPGWYATMFSGLYIPLFLVLFGLIIRGVAFEYRALQPDDRWRDTFDACATIGSLVVALVFGVGFSNLWMGMPVAGDPPHMTQSLLSLFHPFALLGGVTLIVLFTVHGAVFLSLKTTGSVYDKANGYVRKAGPLAVLLVAAWVIWGNIAYPASENPWLSGNALAGQAGLFMWIASALGIVAVAIAWLLHNSGRDILSFIFMALGIVGIFSTIFIKMYGTLGFPAETGVFDMMIAASSPYTLKIMTIVTVVMLPIVLIYIIWSYWVFRKRLNVDQMPPEPSELAKHKAARAA